MKVALTGGLDIGLNNNVSFEAVVVDPNVRFLEVELIFAVNGIGFNSERCEIGVIFVSVLRSMRPVSTPNKGSWLQSWQGPSRRRRKNRSFNMVLPLFVQGFGTYFIIEAEVYEMVSTPSFGGWLQSARLHFQ